MAFASRTVAIPRRDPDDRLVARIRNEFTEMPGLRLTPCQAVRLWNTDAAVCAAAVDALVRSGFLSRDEDGSVMRRSRIGNRSTSMPIR
jgi:hypothetical protein